jgi:hypothetical protein
MSSFPAVTSLSPRVGLDGTIGQDWTEQAFRLVERDAGEPVQQRRASRPTGRDRAYHAPIAAGDEWCRVRALHGASLGAVQKQKRREPRRLA